MTVQTNNIEWFRELLDRSRRVEPRDPAPILGWLEERRAAIEFKADLIALSELRSWHTELETGDIHHESGAFFSIRGVRITASKGLREVDSWDQPIFTQKEGGILALIAKTDGSNVLFLLNAKAEPGNLNTLQLCPTFQATWSNLTQAHKGRRPPFADVIMGEAPAKLVYEASHNEEGGRFWMKANRNQIWLVDPIQAPVNYDPNKFTWASLSQLKELALADNVLSPFVKTVIAPL